jgi:KaiC/GvpD/RAD55 family RecA-like ATPase
MTGGVHSPWAYRQLEAAYEGIVDFKLEDSGGKTRELFRIRVMRNVHFDREWHELKIGKRENFEVTLQE